jgi:hypothetical protein
MITATIAFIVGVVVGAYSHKWLAKVTGAPSNINAGAAEAVVLQKVGLTPPPKV